MGGSKKGKDRKGNGKSKPNKPDITMDGSKKGKQSKGEGKSEPNNSNILGRNLKTFSPMPYSEKTPINDKTPWMKRNLSSIPSSSLYVEVECELERFLLIKVNETYNRARDVLSGLGYGILEIESAILFAGYVHDHNGLLSTIVTNCIDFIENELNPKREAFKNIEELYKSVFEALVDCFMKTRPDMQRSEAMWHLLVYRWDHVLSSFHLPSGCPSKSEDDGVALEAFTAARCLYDLSSRREIAAPDISPEEEVNISSYESWLKLDRNSEDPKNGEVVDLVKEIRHLEEKVKEQKEWAQKKVLDAAIRLSADSLELQRLRIEKVAWVKMKIEEKSMDMSLILKHLQAEESLRQANHEVSLVNDAVKRMELENGKIRAEIEACMLNASESEMELKKVEKREKGYAKRAADAEKRTGVLILQCEEEKKRVMEMEEELLKAEKEADETEKKWRQEIKAKEEMLALVAHESNKAKTQKYRSRVHLSKLRQQVETDRQLMDNRRQSLEDELSRLRISSVIEDSLPENVDIMYNYDEAESSSGSKSHWICMMCKQREVSVVCFPCTHQVLCLPCYEIICKAVGARCPYCRVRIEKSIKVHGYSS